MAWKHTPDLDASFFPRASIDCVELGIPRLLDYLMVANAESGILARARNPATNASGLFQLMPANMPALGWTRGHEAFRALTATEQLPYFRRYFSPHRGKMLTAVGVYVATFLPAFVAHAGEADYVLVARRGLPDQHLGWAYEANAVFDANNDGRITVGELALAIERNWRGPRCAEVELRAAAGTSATIVERAPDEGDLRTWWGVQRALVRLGYDLGAWGPKGDGVDGVPGTITRLQLVNFQLAHGLAPDAVAGPVTRRALEAALTASSGA